jgi:2-oxoglutarate/2-oxoacid ferredoxin oxidoreductase subunit alpha
VAAASPGPKLPLFYGTYPITPASDILHELSRHKNFGVRTFQAEDEIAGIGAAIGAAFAGGPGRHRLLGPRYRPQERGDVAGMAMELPLIVINVQRGGPSTGLPTKPEQSDLLFSCTGGTASRRSR